MNFLLCSDPDPILYYVIEIVVLSPELYRLAQQIS